MPRKKYITLRFHELITTRINYNVINTLINTPNIDRNKRFCYLFSKKQLTVCGKFVRNKRSWLISKKNCKGTQGGIHVSEVYPGNQKFPRRVCHQRRNRVAPSEYISRERITPHSVRQRYYVRARTLGRAALKASLKTRSHGFFSRLGKPEVGFFC